MSILPEEKFFEGWSRFKFNNPRLVVGMAVTFYSSVAKGLKLKVRKFLEQIPLFGKVTANNWES